MGLMKGVYGCGFIELPVSSSQHKWNTALNGKVSYITSNRSCVANLNKPLNIRSIDHSIL